MPCGEADGLRGSEVRRKRATDGAPATIRFWYAQVKRRQLVPELGRYAGAVRSIHDASGTPLALEGYIGGPAFVQGRRTGQLDLRSLPVWAGTNLVANPKPVPCLLWGFEPGLSPAVAPGRSGFVPRRRSLRKTVRSAGALMTSPKA